MLSLSSAMLECLRTQLAFLTGTRSAQHEGLVHV